MHLRRVKRHGSVDAGFTSHDVSRPTSATETFLRRVVRRDGCWSWPGAKNDRGYGQVRFAKKTYFVHRLSFEHFIGPIPDGQEVCHRCDNPECSNPTHLFAATHRANMLDASAKGRLLGNGDLRGEDVGVSKLTERDVHEIRASSVGCTTLAKKYGVDETAIMRVRRRETWKHI